MKHTAKVQMTIEVRSGTVLRSPLGVLVMLVSVPQEDGTCKDTARRWILVTLERYSDTWDPYFYASPEEALADTVWEFYAESPEEAFDRNRRNHE